MTFWWKKVITYWLMPLPLCVALGVVAGLLLVTGRRPRTARALLTGCALLLAILSNRGVSILLLRPLETRYPPVPEFTAATPPAPALRACRYVVVLGGGQHDSRVLPATTQLSTAALGRLTEAVRLLRVLPEARLVTSGPAAPGFPSHGRILARAAAALGVDAARIQIVDTARDTAEEAAAVAALVGPARVALVTSAWHLPRAMLDFRQVGVAALPCPADYGTVPDGALNWHDLGWDLAALERSTWALHERLGLLWEWLRGKR